MVEKLTKLVTPEGNLPDLDAIEMHLSEHARSLGDVLVQEVITYTDMNDPEYAPVIKVGILRGSNRSGNFLELNLDGRAVKFLRGKKHLGVGVARIASLSGMVYEDLGIVEEWNVLFEHCSRLLKRVEPRHIDYLDNPSNVFPVAVFKRECADMLHFLDRYGFSKNEHGVYVPRAEN